MKLLAIGTAAALLVGGCGLPRNAKIGVGGALVATGVTMVALGATRDCSNASDGLSCGVDKQTLPLFGALLLVTGAVVAGIGMNEEPAP